MSEQDLLRSQRFCGELSFCVRFTLRLQKRRFWGTLAHSPLQLIVRRGVLGRDVSELSKDLRAVDGKAREQDELLPGGAEQAGVVLYGELAEERQLLDPGDLAEEQLVRQATQQSEQLHLRHLVPEAHTECQREPAFHCERSPQLHSGHQEKKSRIKRQKHGLQAATLQTQSCPRQDDVTQLCCRQLRATEDKRDVTTAT